jgi:hypothetical protein
MAKDLHPEGEFCCGACKQAAAGPPTAPPEARPLLRCALDAQGQPQGLVLKWTLDGVTQSRRFDQVSVVFGRAAGADVVIARDIMARRQSRFVCEGGQVFVEDLQSSCGTVVDGHKVQRAALRAGSRVWFADVIAWVEHG